MRPAGTLSMKATPGAAPSRAGRKTGRVEATTHRPLERPNAAAPSCARGAGARAAAWASALALSIAIPLPGCAGPRQAAERPADATIAVLLPGSERPFWTPIARSFERDHPGVHVDLVEGPQATDLRENIYTASLLARDPTFDLVYMDVTWTAKFAAAGWLVPLDASFPDSERARFLPAALAAGLYEGRLYRVPVRTDIGVLYYRRDLLAAAGLAPPQTFAELSRAARQLQAPPERWGFAWQGKQYEGLVCDFV